MKLLDLGPKIKMTDWLTGHTAVAIDHRYLEGICLTRHASKMKSSVQLTAALGHPRAARESQRRALRDAQERADSRRFGIQRKKEHWVGGKIWPPGPRYLREAETRLGKID